MNKQTTNARKVYKLAYRAYKQYFARIKAHNTPTQTSYALRQYASERLEKDLVLISILLGKNPQAVTNAQNSARSKYSPFSGWVNPEQEDVFYEQRRNRLASEPYWLI